MTLEDINNFQYNHTVKTTTSRTVIILEDTVIKFPIKFFQLPQTMRSLAPKELFCQVLNYKKTDKKNFISWMGVEQILAEIHVWEICPEEYRHLLCPIIESGFIEDTNIPYLIMKKAIVNENINQKTDFGRKYFENFLRKNFNYSNEEIIRQNEEVFALAEICKIQSYELIGNAGNIGILDGKLTFVDYGWEHFWN